MAEFPKLKTGVVAQYPATKEYRFSTVARRFVDGTEQRHRDLSGSRLRWVVKLSQLNGTEVAEVLEFFRIQQGRLGSFDFEDPWTQMVTQMVIANCHFGQDVLSVRADGEFDNSTELLIVGPRI